MPTRQGWTTLLAALAAAVVGRVFGIFELFLIAGGLLGAVLLALVVVHVRRVRLDIERWVHPAMMTVGERATVDLRIHNRSSWRSPAVALTDPIGDVTTAQLDLRPMPGRSNTRAGYVVPAARRGQVELGPMFGRRTDLLGLARTITPMSGSHTLIVAPRTYPLAMPVLGSGVLGRHLLAMSRRLGPGEFHALRDYAIGDDLRSIHWKASARSDDLKVRQNEAQGVRRCLVILDSDAAEYTPWNDPEMFERAVSIAASIVLAGEHADLVARLVTGDGTDVRGADVTGRGMLSLAMIQPGTPVVPPLADSGDGLGLRVIVTTTSESALVAQLSRTATPGTSDVIVCVASGGGHDGGRRRRDLVVEAPDLPAFLAGWSNLMGSASSSLPLPTTFQSPAGHQGGVTVDAGHVVGQAATYGGRRMDGPVDGGVHVGYDA